MHFPFSVVTGKTLHRLLHSDVPGCLQVVKDAYLTHGAGHSVNPRSYFLTFPEKPGCRIIALPAYLGEKTQVSGIKWIASYPQNIHKGFPRASAVLILNDYETGYPFACLESSIISAVRTAASAVLAAEHLNGGVRKVKTLGLVGNGLIARYLYEFFLGAGWEIDTVQLYDTQPAESERFRAQVARRDRHASVKIAGSAQALVSGCDMVALATVAPAPYLDDMGALAHRPILLNVSLRDLSPELILGSCNIVDDVDHVMNANTSVHLAEQKTGNRDFVTGTLAELMQGRCELDRTRPIVFSPFGLGVLDLAVGKWAYDRARAEGEAVEIDDFFYELTR